MRIIGGKFRSRKLAAVDGTKIRPTADRTRESLFNILRIPAGARFLDAFCGSGAVGIEAISRGAESAFLDCDERARRSRKRISPASASRRRCCAAARRIFSPARRRNST